MYRILFLGESWFGSNARGCASALRRLGCDVLEIDIETFVPQWKSKPARAFGRLIRPIAVREYNRAVLRSARLAPRDFLLAFKAGYLQPETLVALRRQGLKLYNYFPDTSAFSHGKILPRALPEYDCIFHTKPFWAEDVRRKLTLRETVYLPHGYEPDVHYPRKLTGRDVREFGNDVNVVASHTEYKERFLDDVLALRPALNLALWGDRWKENCRSKRVLSHWRGTGLFGDLYCKALQAPAINLALLSGQVKGASRGDGVTTRTYQIPALGGFMLHERNADVAEIFEEGREIACYGSAEEACQKIDFYLARPEERQAMAAAAFQRVTAYHSYDLRMKILLDWHAGHSTRGADESQEKSSLPANR